STRRPAVGRKQRRPRCDLSLSPARLSQSSVMNNTGGTVYVVDDDPSLRQAMGRLCHAAGLEVKTFASAREFLGHGAPSSPACLVLDVRLPGLSGLDLQAELAARDIQTPIVFISGHGDIPTTV